MIIKTTKIRSKTLPKAYTTIIPSESEGSPESVWSTTCEESRLAINLEQFAGATLWLMHFDIYYLVYLLNKIINIFLRRLNYLLIFIKHIFRKICFSLSDQITIFIEQRLNIYRLRVSGGSVNSINWVATDNEISFELIFVIWHILLYNEITIKISIIIANVIWVYNVFILREYYN